MVTGMFFSLIGRQDVVLPPGWTSETNFSALGSAVVDATAPAGPDAKVRTYSLIGSTTVRVAAGARVRLVGGNIVGRRDMDAATGDGPEITVLVGGVRVVHAP